MTEEEDKKIWPRWIVIDIHESIQWDYPHGKIIIMDVLRPMIKWCEDNLGPMRTDGICIKWYSDPIFGTWNEIHFKESEDAAAFILTWGGEKVR